ncbi:MAG: MFS transporter [Ktedonobacteraceae bacterium]
MYQLVEYIQQFGRFQRNARLYLVSNALSGVTAGIFLVLYNLYLVSLGYGPAFIGVELFVLTIGAGLAIFPAGMCVDRFSGKSILIWSSALIGGAGVGQILFRQPLSLLISAFIAGIGLAFILVVNAPFLTRNSAPEERPYLFSFNIVLGLVTTVLGKVIGGGLPIWLRSASVLMARLPPWLTAWLAQQPVPRSYQLALLLAGIIAGPSFIPLFLMRDDRPSAPVVPHSPLAQNTGPGIHSLLQHIKSVRTFLHLIHPKALFSSPIFLLSLVQVLIGLGAGLFIPYTNIYFVQHLKASSWLFGLIDGGATALTALFTLAAPFLAIRLGRVNSIALTQLASIPLLLTIGLTSYLPLAAALYLFRQPLMDMSMGVLQVFSMEAVPKERRGMANSSYQASFQVAWALTASLGGIIIVQLGYPPIFIGGAICYVLAVVTLWGNFGRDKKNAIKTLNEVKQAASPPA